MLGGGDGDDITVVNVVTKRKDNANIYTIEVGSFLKKSFFWIFQIERQREREIERDGT